MVILGYILVGLGLLVGLLGAYQFLRIQDSIQTVGTNRPTGYVQGRD